MLPAATPPAHPVVLQLRGPAGCTPPRSRRWWRWFLLGVWLGAAVSGASAAPSRLRVEPVAAPPLPASLADAWAGRVGSQLLVATKHGAHLIEVTDTAVVGKEWIRVDRPGPTGSARAQEGAALISVGGEDEAGRSLTAVGRWLWAEGRWVEERLPDLPVPLVGAGAAVVEGALYVVGGFAGVDRRPSAGVWRLPLSPTPAPWEVVPDLPRAGVVHPIVLGQGGSLLVIGGWEAAGDLGGDFRWSRAVSLYLPRPREGATGRGWRPAAAVPGPVAGGTGIPVGQAHVAIIGGSDRAESADPGERAAGAPAPSYYYNIYTDAWSTDRGFGLPPDAVVAPTGAGAWLLSAGDAAAGEAAPTVLHRLVPQRSIKTLSWIDYLVIGLYLAGMGVVGSWFARRQTTGESYALGNRRIAWWAAGLSMFATGASAISIMAIPAVTYRTNLVWWFPVLTGIFSFFVQAYLIFPLLRRLELTSTFEYLERRFNLPLRLIASLQQIIFQTFGRIPIVLLLPSMALSATTGLDVLTSVTLMGLITIVYTAQGGFEAVIWTDVAQGLLMVIAPLAIIGIVIVSLPGGVGEFISIGQTYQKFDFIVPSWDITLPAAWILCLGTFFQTTVMQAGDQPVIQRVFSTPLRQVRATAGMMTGCSILIATLVNVMGLAVFAYFHRHPELLDPASSNDQVVPLFIVVGLPVGTAGLVIAAIYAASMSTVSSSVNSVATLLSEDFYRRFRPGAADAARLRLMKAGSYGIGMLGLLGALVLAKMDLSAVFPIWSKMGGLLGGGIVGVYSLGMFTRRANSTGAITGAVASIAVCLGLELYTQVHWYAYMPFSILACMVVGYATSLLTGGPKHDLTGLTVYTPKRSS